MILVIAALHNAAAFDLPDTSIASLLIAMTLRFVYLLN